MGGSIQRFTGSRRTTPRAGPIAKQPRYSAAYHVVTTQAAKAAAACAPIGGREPDDPPPAQLTIELDGEWVRRHDNRLGLEVKVGVVQAENEIMEQTFRCLRQRRSRQPRAG
jgi:hypothetical protein